MKCSHGKIIGECSICAILAASLNARQPSPERPTTELLQSPEGQAAIERVCQKEGWATTAEGEEALAYAYLESVLPTLAKEEYYREQPTRSMTYSAALWGLREGKRLELTKLEERWAGFNSTVGLWHQLQMRQTDEIANLRVQLASAQREAESIRVDLTEALTNVGRERDAAQAELAKWKKSADESWEDAENAEAEVSRLRELLQVAEGALEWYAEPYSYVEGRNMRFECMPDSDVESIGFGPKWDGLQAGGKRAREALARLRSGKDGGKKDA